MFVYGLTGGMGCGKSTVATMFSQHGPRVLDADAIGRDILESDTEEASQVKARFPEAVTSEGALDRRVIAKEVFGDELQRHWLEDLMHPAISRKVEALIESWDIPSKSIVILEGAVLLESRASFDLCGMIVVTTFLGIRMKRIESRDGLTRAEIEKRIDSQLPEWQKILSSDFLIDNSGSLDYTREQVKEVLQLMHGEIGGVQ